MGVFGDESLRRIVDGGFALAEKELSETIGEFDSDILFISEPYMNSETGVEFERFDYFIAIFVNRNSPPSSEAVGEALVDAVMKQYNQVPVGGL